jgi:TolA-binding protein
MTGLLAGSLLLLSSVAAAPAQDAAQQGAASAEVPGNSASGGATALNADRDWQFVKRLRDDGMEDVAARQLLEFAKNYPEDSRAPSALLQAAQIYRHLSQPVGALKAYDQLLQHFPSSVQAPSALLEKGALLADGHRNQEAADAYRSLLTSFPASDQADAARLGLAESVMALDQDEQAERLLHSLVGGRAASPLAARARFDLGVLAQKAGEDSLAIAHFDAIHTSYPGEIVGAFGLLRSAELLRTREAPQAAREHYQLVIKKYSDPYLQARANLGLAILDEAAHSWKQAAKRYRDVAERGGTPEQIQRALLGLGECQLRAENYDSARDAANAYLEKYPDAGGTPRARLLLARADAQQDKEGAREELLALTSSPDSTVAYGALSGLAKLVESSKQVDEKEHERARVLWQKAASVAPSDSLRSVAWAKAAQITSRALGRHALAADLFREAAEAEPESEMQAQYLLQQVQELQAAGQEDQAMQVSQTVIRRYPTSEQAASLRQELELKARRIQKKPEEAIRRLSQLALHGDESGGDRRMAVGMVLRDLAGDAEAAAKIFEELSASASDSLGAARAYLELGKSRQQLALEARLDSASDSSWKDQWSKARKAYARAAELAPRAETGKAARSSLLKLELAERAQPQTPPLFDAERTPLLGGYGAQEGLDLRQQAWVALGGEMRAVLKGKPAKDSRAWLLWRAAELSTDLPDSQRIIWLKEGLAQKLPPAREQSLRYALAWLYHAQQKDDLAAAQLRQVMDAQDAGNLGVAARYLMAEIQRQQQHYAAAKTLYESYARTFPSSQLGQRSLLLAGDMALYGGDPDAAASIYQTLLQRYENGVYTDDADYRLATAQMRRGRIEDARRRFQALAAQQSKSRYAGRSLLKLSQLESSAGHDSLATDALTRLSELDPQLAQKEDVFRRLAELQLERGRPQAALRWLDRYQEDPATARTLALRVRALAQAGKLGSAAEELKKLSEGYPEAGALVPQARLDLADALLDADKGEDALALYELVEKEPVTKELLARAKYGEGMYMLKAQRFDDASEAFKSAAAATSHSEWSAQALFKVANLAARDGDDEGARKAYQQLVDEYPHHSLRVKAMKGLAMSWRRLERYDKALEVYHSLLEEQADLPDAEQILSNIAYCYHELGRYELSIAAYKRVMPLLSEEDQAYGQFWIADSLEKLQRFEEAAAAYLKIPYLYPKSGQLPVTAQLKAAGVYQKMGQLDAATKLYQKVIKQHGAKSQWGAEAVRRLDAMQKEAKSGGS